MIVNESDRHKKSGNIGDIAGSGSVEKAMKVISA
jgi:hypothetical protein